VCKNGDLISYLYSKANRLPVTYLHNIEGPPSLPDSVQLNRFSQTDDQ
jgi:hypothetical protein